MPKAYVIANIDVEDRDTYKEYVAKVPATVAKHGGEFLVQPHGIHFTEVRASDLLRVTEDGRVLSGKGKPDPTARFIHGRMHIGIPAARCVLHTHMRYATALAALKNGRLAFCHLNAMRFYGKLAYDSDYNGIVLDEGEGDRISNVMADKTVLFMANHGVAVIGPTIAQAFDDLYYLERACETQVIAMSTGEALLEPSQDAILKNFEQWQNPLFAGDHHFAAIRRILDREEPDYRH